jgi:hypothetical protein
MGDLVIENNELQEVNQFLKNDLIVLNKYDSEKYMKLDRALVTKSGNKTIAKQYLWNKLQDGRHRVLIDHNGRNVPIVIPPKQKQ